MAQKDNHNQNKGGLKEQQNAFLLKQGSGDYTEERREWAKNFSLDDVALELKLRRKRIRKA